MQSPNVNSGEIPGARDLSSSRRLPKEAEGRPDGYCSAVMIARCYEGLGDMDRTLAWLNTAYDERDGLCPFLDRWPPYDPVRSDPRFQALMGRMNFPQQP